MARKRLAERIKTLAAQTNAVGAEKACGTDKHLRGFLSAIKYPLFRAFPPIKNPAVSGVCIIFKTGHTKKCLTVFPLHNHFAKRVVRVVRAVFPLKIFIVHHFAHFLLGGIIRLYILG